MAVLSLGSNLGDRAAHLSAAIELLRMHVPVVAVSPVYETAPVGVQDVPAFLNVAVLVAADDPWTLLDAAHRVEDARGRLRSKRWGPRTLDVDVISAEGLRSESPTLTLPHPRAHERAFVLVPWLDVDPDAELPGRGRVADLVRAMDTSGVRRWSR
jgi:2-amino-4-hydroxy-6-hydroxymethyldihydropteridine diphosphokinase